MLRLCCLGPFHIEADGQSVSLPTRKTAALLAYLVLYPELHDRERLVSRFWGDSPDKQARRSLRTALSALRKALGERYLLADRETVQLNPNFPIWTDAITLRNQAQCFLNQPVVEPSLVDVTLYQGDFLDSFYDDWVLREREALRQLYLRVLARLAQHWRAQGDYPQTIEIAQRMLALEPAEESAHQHLLFCYTVSGDRQAAHQQYEACVRALREELDVDPAPETQALYRRSQQIRTRKFSLTAAHTNLPLPLASFIGRVSEIAKLKTLLLGDWATTQRSPARLVTVTGPGGCGKTRLAIEVARELTHTYADGVWWVELAALSDESQVPQAVAKVLDVQQGVQPSLTDVLITNLRTKQTLLVLDNCEHLIVACAELVERLLSHCPDLQILATSREALGIFGETSWLVPSLTVPAAPLSSVAEYLQFEAIHLFVERASALQQNFALSAANAPAILQICRQLDGIPLAIELAVVRVKLMTVEQIAVRLTDVIGARFELLTEGSRTVLPRQQTLRATMAWSYTLLNEQEQRLLQQFAIFAGGWDLEAAEAVGTMTSGQSVAAILARLVDKSLVLVEHQGTVARYRMLETIRQYAYEQLENTGDISAARDRHLAYFLYLAKQGEPEFRSRGQLTWLRRLDTEYENLRAALAWGLQHKPTDVVRLLDGAILATALIFYWKLHGDSQEGCYWLQSVELLRDASVQIADTALYHQITTLRAKALYGAGVMVWHQGKSDEARYLFDASAEIWRAIGNDTGLYRAQIFQGDLCVRERNLTAAFALWQECLAYFRQVQDRWSMAETIFYWGYGERRAGNYTMAACYYKECIRLLQPLGERWLLSLATSHLGIIALEQGDYAKAYPLIEQRLRMGREFGLKNDIYTALDQFSKIAYRQGDIRQAVKLVREAIVIEQQAGRDLLWSLFSDDKLGITAFACAMDGQNERAIRLLAARHALLSTIGYEGLRADLYDAEPCLTHLRARLGADSFTTAWAIGAAMTPEQALEEVLAEE